MRNKLQLSEITETLNRGKNYYEVFGEIYELADLFGNSDDSKLLEYVPVKIVACFENFFREEYKEIIFNPKTKKRLKEIDLFKKVQFDFDVIGAFEDNTITLGDYLSYLPSCSKLEDINNTLRQLLDIEFIDEICKKDKGEELIKSIKEIFTLRHIYCHEVPLKNKIDKKMASQFISDACQFLEYSDDTIRNALYSDNFNLLEELDNVKTEYEKSDKELEELVFLIRSNQNKDSLFYNDLAFVDKWKEYREVRAKSDSSLGHDSYSPLHYYRSLTRTTTALIKELKDDFKYELRK